MFKIAKTPVKVNAVEGRDFTVEVGVHQGSVLSPTTLYHSYGKPDPRGLTTEDMPWELLYADDLVLLADP